MRESTTILKAAFGASLAQDDVQSIAHDIDELAERIRALHGLGAEELLPLRYSALGLWNAASLAEMNNRSNT